MITTSRYTANTVSALYDEDMQPTGNLRVSERGQMSLPAAARHRWNLDAGGRIAYLDLGDAIVIVPESVEALRTNLLDAIGDETWQQATQGFGDDDLATQ